MNNCHCPFYLSLSPIKHLTHGKGLFTNRYYPTDSFVLQYKDAKGNLNNFSKFLNYSPKWNLYMKKEKDDSIGLYAAYPIYQGYELTIYC